MPTVRTDDRELLVTGRGRFIADIAPDDCVEVCFVRSPVPHAGIRSVELGSAQATWGAELGLQPLRLEAGGMVTVLWHPLPTERVRYVGEPVAMAWSADRYAAEDLAEAVSVDYAPLPPGTPSMTPPPTGCCSPAPSTPAAWTRSWPRPIWCWSEPSRPPASRRCRWRVEGSSPSTTRRRT